MDLENFGGASTLLCIDFLKLWGGQCPPGPPGSGGPDLKQIKEHHCAYQNIAKSTCKT